MTTQIAPSGLQDLIEKQAVKIVDGSWALDGTDMHALYEKEHIPSAVFFDIDAVSDHSTALPHMAPTAEMFSEAIGKMGISADDHVVIYDRQGLFSAARVWWTFKLMGHEKAEVLRGGLPAWKVAGLPVTDADSTIVPTNYQPHLNQNMVLNIHELQKKLDNEHYAIFDARPAARFYGEAPEPRAGLRSGHMPNARSLPIAELIRDGALKPRNELEAIFSKLKLAPSQTAITTCGSGVTAAVISMALAETGHTQAILYDGSWAEWGQEALDTPVVTDRA
jgi:thiosulfate/3-mercaptopyruvate sulfurtransferase